ncbi:MAG: response regulator [Acidobacteria bacterium]|nr:response regulator [Acidobacteriota bacterium]
MQPTLRILVIEDRANDAELMIRELERAGLEIAWERVASEEEFVRRLDPAPDAILADYMLPQFDALQALRRVQERGLDVPFLIVSGEIGEEVAVAAMKAGAHDYVMKGNLSRLAPALEREVREAQTRRERRKAEQAYRESEQRFAAFMRHLEGSAFIKDSQGRFLFLNEFGQRLFRDLRWTLRDGLLDGTDDPAAAAAIATDQIVLETGRPAQTVQEILHGPATVRHWLVNKFPITSPDGGPVLLGGIALEITEQKRLEERLRLSQKLEAVGQLAGGVAHDFNNLLTVIQGYGQMLREALAAGHDGIGMLDEMLRASDRAAGLTRQLLAFSRKQILEPKVLNLNGVIGEVEKMLRRLIGENIEIRTLLEPRLGMVKVDQGQIEQVIVNLAVNARDAMPEGGELIIETSNADLEEAGSNHHDRMEPGRYVLLAVRDTGIGMDKATQAQIFEPFFTTKERGKGTGMGLATTYGIVKQSGGYIWVDSGLGRGSTFRVYLPRTGEEAAAWVSKPAFQAPVTGHETVLVVEDEPSVRDLVQRLLQMQGYTVLAAGLPGEALEIVRERGASINLLLTDVLMPQMDGKQLAEQARSLRPGLKVLYMSGYADETIVSHGVLEPGAALLHKPFQVGELVRKVREVLDGVG